MTITFSSPEILVNGAIAGDQILPSVAALADGRFIVVWETSDPSIDGSLQAIRGQIFHADGSRAGAEFLINTTTAQGQRNPAVTALRDGGFIVSWTDDSATLSDPTDRDLRSQLFGPSGGRIGGELTIPFYTEGAQAAARLATLSDGRIVMVWEHAGPDDPDDDYSNGLRMRVVNPDGTAATADLPVNDIFFGNQDRPSVTALADGGWFVVWQDDSGLTGDLSGLAIHGRRFSANGTALTPDVLINATTANSQMSPAVTALRDDRIVVVWDDISGTGGDAQGSGIKARVLSAGGTPEGAEILVNTTTAGNQTRASVTALADGGFLVAWVDVNGRQGSGDVIVAQAFAADGTKAGAETVINTRTAGPQLNPMARTLADGRVVITWEDFSQSPDDPSGWAIRARIVDPRQSGIDLAGTARGDDWFGTGFADRLRGAGGNDTLRGAAGDDLIDGGTGADRMIGGAGNDTYLVESAGDRVIESAGEGRDLVRAWVSHRLAAHVENLTLVSDGALNGTGNALANRLTGGAGDNRLNGAGGNDVLRGGAGRDVALGGLGRDTLSGDRGHDRLEGAGGADRLTGGEGNDTLLGGAQDDVLIGGAGRDRMQGDAGRDLMIGDRGADRMTGGAGADTFQFRTLAETGRGAARDVITDFRPGEDRIDLSRLLRDGEFIAARAFTGTAGEVRYSDGILEGDIDGDGADDFQIGLTGRPAISADDILF